ncbi:MAG: hypothetical protein M1839_004934 [Geoglossum umbratile]|nr:MAG: hypothetical protein M1839_004934 [Geoglossum umbratile]
MPVPLHRRALVIVVLAVTLIFFLLTSLPSSQEYADTPIHHVDASQSTLHGEVIMPKLGNETENGECAGHFRQILAQYPPQTASRSSAAAWACHVHNIVNKSLKKPVFDCSKIGEFYKCGCADEEEGLKKGGEDSGAGAAGSSGASKTPVQRMAKQVENDGGELVPDSKGTRMKLEREG